MTEHKFGKSYINYLEKYEVTPFEIVLGDKYFGNQQLTKAEAKGIADYIYECLGLKEKEIIPAEITEQEKAELIKAIEENGKNLATFTISK